MAIWTITERITGDLGSGLRLTVATVTGCGSGPRLHLGRWDTGGNGELDHRRWSGFVTVDELRELRAELNKLNMDELRTAITAPADTSN